MGTKLNVFAVQYETEEIAEARLDVVKSELLGKEAIILEAYVSKDLFEPGKYNAIITYTKPEDLTKGEK